DFEPEEIHHRCSVSTSLLRCSWNHTTINLLDTPGALSLLGEAITALQAADAVIVVLNPASGIRSELLRLWSQVKALGLPCLIFVNELEKESGSTEELLAACHRDVDLTPLPMSCALKDGAQWIGVLDFVSRAAVHSRPDTAKWQQQPVPPGAEATLADARKRIPEAAAECDDQLLEQYLSGAELSQADVLKGLRTGVQAGTIVPLYTGSALKNVGTVPLLNAIVDFLPSPMERGARTPLEGLHPDTGETGSRRAVQEDPFSGIVFKTLIDPFVGRLSYTRVLSGILHADSIVYNSSRRSKEKSGHLYTVLGKKHTAVPSAGAGEIVAIRQLKENQTADTTRDAQ